MCASEENDALAPFRSDWFWALELISIPCLEARHINGALIRIFAYDLRLRRGKVLFGATPNDASLLCFLWLIFAGAAPRQATPKPPSRHTLVLQRGF